MLQLMEASKLARIIAVVGSQKARIERTSQIAAVQCIGQSIVHRNITPAQQLYDVMGKSLRRASLLQYFEANGNIAWDKNARKIVFKDNSRTFDDETVALLMKKPWYEAKKEEEPVSIFDVEAAAEKFLDQLKKKIKDTGLTIQNRELYDQLHNVFLRYVVDTADKVHEPEQPGQHEVTQERLHELAEHFGKPQVKIA